MMKIKLLSVLITLSLILTLFGPALPAAGKGSKNVLPDLSISDSYERWVVEGKTYKVIYEITNEGDGDAPAGYVVSLTVDGIEVEQKKVPIDLATGQSYESRFSDVAFSPPKDKIIICVDKLDEVAESDEDNN